jgi:3-hydroxyacyl-CoA dehydrogenase
MKLVEIVRTDHTSEETYQTAKAFVQTIKKTGITCKDTPGFVVNRLLVPYMAQAIALVERGDASPEDVDIAMQLGAGHPMGPIHLSDYVGNDINNFVLQGWVDNFPEEPAFMVPDLLKQKIAAKELGRKTGKGFYEWDGPNETFPNHMKKK